MPNTVPVNDSPETTRWMLSPERGASIRVFPIAAATRGSMGEKLTEYGSLKAAGAVAVSDDAQGLSLGDAIMRREALIAAAARAGLPVIQHAEDTRLTSGCSMNAGAMAFRMGLRGMPVEAESGLVERDLRLLASLNGARGHLHVAHLSTKAALEAVRKARRNGLHVTCEVAPHHFLLTEETVGLYDTNAKMNPPLRSQADRDAMLQGILGMGLWIALRPIMRPMQRMKRSRSSSVRRMESPAWRLRWDCHCRCYIKATGCRSAA